MTRRQKFGAAAETLWENADAVLVMAVAAIVLALHLLDNVSQAAVSSATLALLGVTAFVLLRDRRSRTDLRELRQIATDALSDLPYDILSQENMWDIQDRRNARIRMNQRLRFTRNEVFALTHRSAGDGTITRCVAKWRRKGSTWSEAPKIDEVETLDGNRLLFSLGEEQSRGDILDWCVERDAVDRFSARHEGIRHVAKTADFKFPRRMRILWPPQEPPHHVEMRLGDRPAQRLAVRTKKGRAFIDETIQELRKGETLVVSWTW